MGLQTNCIVCVLLLLYLAFTVAQDIESEKCIADQCIYTYEGVNFYTDIKKIESRYR